MFAATAQYAREVIHAFNEKGFAALDPKWSGGRPRKFGSVAREIVCRVAKTPPQQLGCRSPPGACPSWSSTSPRGIGSWISTETVRTDPARGRDQLAGHQDLAGQQGF